ncbi:MAG TPA: ABC transporter substrate-binding protein, partial [Blastocatellia bacterium]|nr:ABC transporter substrate-binding protein [Blastocatellia bacterium]
MRKTLAAVLIAGMLTVAACTDSGSVAGPTGSPNPPFEGDPPQDAYLYKGETGTYGGTMVLGLQTDVGTFNVIRATDDITAGLLWYHIYRTPIDYRNGDDPPDYDPGLCTKWEVSPDAKQWTFHLRKGVRWSDGAPFTADDVLFTYDVIRDEKVENALRDVFIEGNEETGEPIYPDLVKLDDHTFQFNLHSSNGGFLDAVFNLYLIPKHKWEESWRAGMFNEKLKISDDPKDVVGLGPFRV